MAGRYCLIGLGASVPAAPPRLRQAIRALEALPQLDVVSVSDIIDTAAFGGVTAQRFANAAIVGRSALAPAALLRMLWSVEARFGRVRGEKNGPRTLDLDLLAVENLRFKCEGLELPHPGLRTRPFARGPALAALSRAPQCATLALGVWVR